MRGSLRRARKPSSPCSSPTSADGRNRSPSCVMEAGPLAQRRPFSPPPLPRGHVNHCYGAWGSQAQSTKPWGARSHHDCVQIHTRQWHWPQQEMTSDPHPMPLPLRGNACSPDEETQGEGRRGRGAGGLRPPAPLESLPPLRTVAWDATSTEPRRGGQGGEASRSLTVSDVLDPYTPLTNYLAGARIIPIQSGAESEYACLRVCV